MLRTGCLLAVMMGLVAGCATPPRTEDGALSGSATDVASSGLVTSFAPVRTAFPPIPNVPPRNLAGRTLTVGATEEIVLEPGEVILTFDDGPRPGTTDSILETLDRFGAKATFLMLGSAAERNPGLALEVAERGHTVGTHTYDHIDLSTLGPLEAVAEIYAGQQAVAAALAPAGIVPSRFFRFPYLAQTGVIRTSVVDSRFIVLDVDVDSKDYYSETPQQVLERALGRLDARGSGVVLFHDIHRRTAAVLPDFLSALGERGYRVVTLRSSGGGVFDAPMVTAELPGSETL